MAADFCKLAENAITPAEHNRMAVPNTSAEGTAEESPPLSVSKPAPAIAKPTAKVGIEADNIANAELKILAGAAAEVNNGTRICIPLPADSRPVPLSPIAAIPAATAPKDLAISLIDKLEMVSIPSATLSKPIPAFAAAVPIESITPAMESKTLETPPLIASTTVAAPSQIVAKASLTAVAT